MPLVSPEIIAQWPEPNYDDPISRGPDLLVISAVFIAIAGTLVILRLYTRIFITHFFGWDDGLILAALIFAIILTIGVDVGFSNYGWDRHIWDIPLTKATSSLLLNLGMQIDFICAQFAINLSFLCFYFRLTNETNLRWFRVWLYVTVAILVVLSPLYVFLLIFQCSPIRAQWTPIENAHCMNYQGIVLSANIVKVFFDVLITTLPIPLIARMKISRRQKWGIICLLSLGYVVTAAGILRTYYTWLLTTAPLGDETWDLYPAFLATSIETDLSIICACVPTLRPLIRRIWNLGSTISTSKMASYESRTFGSSHKKAMHTEPLVKDTPSESNWPLRRLESVPSVKSAASQEKAMELPIMGSDATDEIAHERGLDSRNISAISIHECKTNERGGQIPKEMSTESDRGNWVIRIHDEFILQSEENLHGYSQPRWNNIHDSCRMYSRNSR